MQVSWKKGGGAEVGSEREGGLERQTRAEGVLKEPYKGSVGGLDVSGGLDVLGAAWLTTVGSLVLSSILSVK